MYFYYKLDISYNTTNHNGMYLSAKIKNEIDFDEIIQNAKKYNLLKNEENIKFSSLYNSDIKEVLDIYIATYNVELENIIFKVDIIFYKLIKPELFTSNLLILNNKLYNIVRHHYIIDNNLNKEEFQHYQIEKLCKILENNRILDLRFTQPLIMNTVLFPFQRDSINWILEQEQSNNYIRLSNQKIMHLPCNLIFNDTTNEIMLEEQITKYIIRGGIIADDLGVGKTIQMLTAIMVTPEISTLILVPDHIKKHWISEIQKHFIVTHLNYNLLSFSEFKCINLKEFDRIVVDELHELYDENKQNHDIYNIITKFDFKYRWGLTATPFINKKSLFYLIKFLCNTSENNIYSEIMASYKVNQINLIPFFRRNMKDNILSLPEIKINDIFVNFTTLERNIYESELSANSSNINTLFLRKVCSDIMSSLELDASNTYTPEELKNIVLQKYQSEYDKSVAIYTDIDNQIKNIEKNIKLFEKKELHINLHAYTEKLKKQQQTVDSRKRVLDRYIFTIDEISEISKKKRRCETNTICIGDKAESESEKDDEDENLCSICLNEYDEILTYLDLCGHYYCKMCFDAYSKSQSNLQCPMCRTRFTKADIKVISNDVVQTMSTKTKEIIKIIKSSNSEQFVVFTQFHSLIKNIKVTLGRYNIGCTDFQEYLQTGYTEQVLLLSSTENASGLDLSFIRNVIIIEPFENYIYGKEIEKQLIGRLHRINQTNIVNVYRMIIRNSIEEQIYSKM